MRSLTINIPVIRLELPSADISVKFVDPTANLDLIVRMGKDCTMSAAIHKWYHYEPVQFIGGGPVVSPFKTPRQIGWTKFEDKVEDNNSGCERGTCHLSWGNLSANRADWLLR